MGPLKMELRAHLPEKRPNYNRERKMKADQRLEDEDVEETSLANRDAFWGGSKVLGTLGC